MRSHCPQVPLTEGGFLCWVAENTKAGRVTSPISAIPSQTKNYSFIIQTLNFESGLSEVKKKTRLYLY